MFSAELRSLVLVVLVAYIQSSYAHNKKERADKHCYSKMEALTGSEMTTMLAGHNKIRKQLSTSGLKCKTKQPQSQPLQDLKWDPKLAKKACDVSKTCKMHHLPVKGELEKKYTCVGQNLWKGTVDDDSADSVDAVAAWAQECDNYNVKEVKENELYDTGHFTQLVWNETEYVGCCQSTFKESGKTKQLISCNYGPCGNFNGHAAFTPLKP